MLRKIFFILWLFFIINSALSQGKEFTGADLLHKKISLNVQNKPLDNILDQLSKQTQCYFTYNADQIDGSLPVTISLSNVPLNKALDTLLQNPNFIYELINNQVVIHTITNEGHPNLKELNQSVIVKCKVADAGSGEPLPFATIAIKNSSFGAITNESGEFTLKIPERFKTDTLLFSYMGYSTRELPVAAIKNQQDILLQPAMVSLQEIIIRNMEPEILLKKARDLMSENYYNKAYNYEAFYREAVKRNSRYLVYSEALIDGYKPSFLLGSPNDRVQLIKSRKFTNLQLTDTLMVKLRGGMETCFQLDLVHQLPDFLTEEGEQNYNYSLSDIMVWEDELVYVIDFKQKDYIQEALFEGSVYISVKNCAYVGAKFAFSSEKLRKSTNLFVIKKSRHLHIKPVSTMYLVKYDNWNGRYYVRHVRGELTLKVKGKGKLFSDEYSTMMEMVYSKIDTVDVRKPLRKDLFQTHTIFSDIDYNYDNNFWVNDITITPEEDILEAFKKSGFDVLEQGQNEP